MKRRWKVLLCGYYGMGNLGDELLASASIELLESYGVPRDRIAMLSGNRRESFSVHKVDSIDRWDLKKIFSALRKSESLLLGGGGIFQDSSSFRSPFYYWLIVRAARFAGCKVWAVGQSIGPLSHFLNRALTRDAFRCCSSVLVRDVHSYEFLRGKCRLTDDLVLSLQKKNSPEVGADYLLVNFRRTRGNLEYEAAKAVKNLSIAPDLKIAGVAMDKDDAKLMEEMASKNLLALDELFLPSVENVEEIFSRGKAGFGMRLHFGVMCLRAGIPFGMVPYDPKVSDFARRWNVPLWSEEKINRQKSSGDSNAILEARKKIHDEFYACFENVK